MSFEELGKAADGFMPFFGTIVILFFVAAGIAILYRRQQDE